MIVAKPKPPAADRIHLYAIPWETYVALREGLGDRPVRVTYDRGEMEIMSPSSRHEWPKKKLAQLVEALCDVLAIDRICMGSLTFQREELEKGFEPDECYWIENETLVRDCDEYDSDRDPPPDLALEIEVSRGVMDRMRIYGAFRVPEVWCWDGVALRVYHLASRGAYRLAQHSKAFPFLPLGEFAQFLHRSGVSDTQLVRSFRAWVKKNRRKWKA